MCILCLWRDRPFEKIHCWQQKETKQAFVLKTHKTSISLYELSIKSNVE